MRFIIQFLKTLLFFPFRLLKLAFLLCFLLATFVYVATFPGPRPKDNGYTVNDVTGLNPIPVAAVKRPLNNQEIINIVKETDGPLSIGGGRFSMGGQTASEQTTHIDLRGFNDVLTFDKEKRLITVEAGIRWRDVQEHIDPYNLSVKIMQSYANFSVGGSLSVNAHGRYMGYGALVHSVKEIRLVLADGTEKTASRSENSELFFAAIGGYGAIGIITEITLELEENDTLERIVTIEKPENYLSTFKAQIRPNRDIIMHNADIIPDDYDKLYLVNWQRTNKAPTINQRLQPQTSISLTQELANFFILSSLLREPARKFYELLRRSNPEVVYRNYEASYDVSSLGKISDDSGSYVLQEYFIPIDRFDSFSKGFIDLLKKHSVDVVNISVRHAIPDPDTLLSWSPVESFAFVLYYYQQSDQASKIAVGEWTRKAIDLVLQHDGKYYLPYQPWADKETFFKSYPQARELFALKSTLDPDYRFRNSLWDAYYQPTEARKIMETCFQIPDFYRPENQTFFTVPEWFLVYASEAQAYVYENAPPHEFRYFGSLVDFWVTYLAVVNSTRQDYPVSNWGYHFMNAVIGISTTVEYLVKGLYEQTIGRISFAFKESGSQVEQFIAQTYKEYASFLQQQAWFHFDFKRKAQELSAMSVEGQGFRALERKYSFLLELWSKHALSLVFTGGRDALYDTVKFYTYVTARGELNAICTEEANCEVVAQISDTYGVLRLPRYRAFTKSLQALEGLRIIDIAGNKRIVISTIKRPNCSPPESATELFDWEIPGEEKKRRVTMLVPVEKVMTVFKHRCLKVEHIYDY